MDFIFSMAVCHSALPEIKDEEIFYNGPSPDELAFVYFAKLCGVKFEGIDELN